MLLRSCLVIPYIFCVLLFRVIIIIFVDWVTQEKKFYGNFPDTLEKRSMKGLLRGYCVYPEPWEAAVSQELVNENLGMPQTGTCVHYGSKEQNDYRTLTAARKVSRVCSLFPMRLSLGCR